MKTLQILEILEMFYPQYDNYRYECFTDYCAVTGREQHLPMKLLVSNDYLMNWYHDSWNRNVEEAFLRDQAHYTGIRDRKAHRNLFNTYPQEIKGTYPNPILKEIRRQMIARPKNLSTSNI